MYKLVFIMAGGILLMTAPAFAEDLPSTAKQVSMQEFQKFADGKVVHVEIIDDPAGPITGDLTWSWKKKRITGTAKVGADTVKVSVALSFSGDKACSNGKGEKPSCHTIHIDGKKFYEVRDDGKIHAISTLAD